MVCAETEHVSIRLLAGPMLTIGPKRNSEALIRGFRSVARLSGLGVPFGRFKTIQGWVRTSLDVIVVR